MHDPVAHVSAPELDLATDSLTETVAKLVSTTNQIGRAERLLKESGHGTVLARNTIVVDGLVTAQFVGGAGSRWVVWSLAGDQPKWVIGVSTDD